MLRWQFSHQKFGANPQIWELIITTTTLKSKFRLNLRTTKTKWKNKRWIFRILPARKEINPGQPTSTIREHIKRCHRSLYNSSLIKSRINWCSICRWKIQLAAWVTRTWRPFTRSKQCLLDSRKFPRYKVSIRQLVHHLQFSRIIVWIPTTQRSFLLLKEWL